MAITVRDIQEKEFATQAKGGYDVEEVDDFLDEIAGQLGALARENKELGARVSDLEAKLEAAQKAAEEAEKKTPDYNEKGYFENLQKSMREAMIGAQRIADETKAEAQAQADQLKSDAQAEAEETLSKAQAEANRITGEASAKLETLTQQFEAMKSAAKAFRVDFGKLLEAQNALLRDKNNLF